MKNAVIIGLFILAVMLPALGCNWGLTESSEARYAEISREMYTSGDYIHPRLLGIRHYHKPPVTYYLTSLGYLIFGVNEYGARFFLQLALLFQLLLVYKISLLLYNNPGLSLTATLIYFSYPIVQIAAKNLTTDAYLTTFIYSSIYFFLKYRQQNESVGYLYFFYVFCGISFLTKGPVGVLPQVLFAVLYTRTFKPKRSFTIHALLALLLGIAICSSWFIILFIQNGNLIPYFLKYQLADRVATNAFNRSKPFWYYAVFLPLLGLPAFCYFADYLRITVRKSVLKEKTATALLITLTILFITFSISSSKLVFYVLPLYLFIAILSARHLCRISAKSAGLFDNISLSFGFFIFAVLIAACFIPLPLALPALPVLLLSLTGIICLWLFKRTTFKRQYQKAPVINALTMVILIFILPVIMRANELKVNSIKPVATFINERSKNTSPATIAVYDYLLPSLAFYTEREIITLNNGSSITRRETQFETHQRKWQNTYLKPGEKKDSLTLSRLLSNQNTYLIAQKKIPLPDSLSYIKKTLRHKIIMEKWIVYY